MKIGVVVHGPEIIDSGYAQKILDILGSYGEVQARLGGTMGRTAVIDAHMEKSIDISRKLLPSQSVDIFHKEQRDVIFLINYGKSNITGHAFGYKVHRKCPDNPPLIQIERPGEEDGTIVAWRDDLQELASRISSQLNLKIVSALEIAKSVELTNPCQQESRMVCRTLAGVSPQENIFVNGIVVGKSTSSEVALVAEDGVIKEIVGGEIKEHGVEKLGRIDLGGAIIKTGLLRNSKVKPRVISTQKGNGKFNVAFLNHAAEDIYRLRDADMVVTVGDDTTLVAADILYRFNVPIIGITDGDLDKVVENGFKALGSITVELDSGLDDLVGERIFLELFNRQETMEIENMENFKSKILQIINKTTSHYQVKQN